jgi:isocitrate lyase
VRDQNTFSTELRRKRLMTLIHLFLIHRYKVVSVHYVSPTDDNRYQTQKMQTHGIFTDVATEVGQIIVADIDTEGITRLLEPERAALTGLIHKTRDSKQPA